MGGKERVIPFNMIETVGERLILKKEQMGQRSSWEMNQWKKDAKDTKFLLFKHFFYKLSLRS